MLGYTTSQNCSQISFIKDRNMAPKQLNSTSDSVRYVKFLKQAWLDHFAPCRPHYLHVHQIWWSSRGLKLVVITCKILQCWLMFEGNTLLWQYILIGIRDMIARWNSKECSLVAEFNFQLQILHVPVFRYLHMCHRAKFTRTGLVAAKL